MTVNDPNAVETPPATPPWGDNFDAETAWTLVENLRKDKKALQDKVTEIEAERDTATAAAQAAEAEKVTATEDATKARRELHIERVRGKHELDDDLLDFLTGTTEEEIEAQAERLAKRVAKVAAPAEPEKPEEPKAPELPAKPKPNLTPGHGGEEKTPFDPDAAVTAIRANR